MPKNLVSWIKKTAVNFIDPEREERVSKLVKQFNKELKEKRQKFDFNSFVKKTSLDETDLEEAKWRVFRRVLDRIWEDDHVTDKELSTVNWVSKSLQLSDKKSYELRVQYAVERFSIAFANAMDDMVLTSEEESHLANIAESVGESLPQFARKHFLKEGERFLRGVFLASIEDGSFSERRWESLLTISEKIGLTKPDVLSLIEKPAQRFISHVLADATSDGEISEDEARQIEWLLTTFQIKQHYRVYVDEKLAYFNLLRNINLGNLPSKVPPQNLGVRSGELLHYECDAQFLLRKQLKAGMKEEVHTGTLLLFDSRAIFNGLTKSQTINYKRIISFDGGTDWMSFQLNGKPEWRFIVSDPNNPDIASAIFSKAIQLANQTAISANGSDKTRHIPRDVRQRVWQRYGGRCAECSADDYLEFDHIIPFSKGGSNSDGNIQLLCRKCNQKKSNFI